MIFIGGNRILGHNFGHLQIVSGSGTELEVQSGLTWDFKSRPVNGVSEDGPNTPGYGDPDN